jgi:transposase
MKSYSPDLRQKIIQTRQEEKLSIRQLAQRFKVSKSFVQKILKQYKETGDLRPKQRGGSPPKKLNEEQLLILIEIIETNNDATLEELGLLLEEKTKVKVSRTTIWNLSQKLNYTLKKKQCMPLKKPVKKYNKKE